VKNTAAKALVDPTVTVEELLRGSKRCVVQLLGTLNRAETCAKLPVQRFGVITHHLEPAAFGGTFGTKRAENDVTAKLDAAGNLPYVTNPLLRCRKEMEYRAIMAEVVRTRFQFDFGDIADKPTHLLRSRTQSALSEVDCVSRANAAQPVAITRNASTSFFMGNHLLGGEALGLYSTSPATATR
jgi:hypothetical protein